MELNVDTTNTDNMKIVSDFIKKMNKDKCMVEWDCDDDEYYLP